MIVELTLRVKNGTLAACLLLLPIQPIGVAGSCKLVLRASQSEPFIDGRRLRRVLVDGQGNVFLETTVIQSGRGEYVFLPKQSGSFWALSR